MVSIPCLKTVFREPNVGFFLVAVSTSHSRLIYNVSHKAISLHGTVIFDSTVASPFLAGPFSLFVDDCMVVGGYYGFNVWRAGVA